MNACMCLCVCMHVYLGWENTSCILELGLWKCLPVVQEGQPHSWQVLGTRIGLSSFPATALAKSRSHTSHSPKTLTPFLWVIQISWLFF